MIHVQTKDIDNQDGDISSQIKSHNYKKLK